MDKELICTFCEDPIEGFALEGPSGALICIDCINTLLEIMMMEAAQQQAQHSTLN